MDYWVLLCVSQSFYRVLKVLEMTIIFSGNGFELSLAVIPHIFQHIHVYTSNSKVDFSLQLRQLRTVSLIDFIIHLLEEPNLGNGGQGVGPTLAFHKFGTCSSNNCLNYKL